MRATLRLATPADSAQIADVYLAARQTFLTFAPVTHSEAEIRQWIAESLVASEEVIVAETVAGLAGFMALSHDQDVDWIDQLYLRPSAVGQGIGTQLLNHAKQQLGGCIQLYTFQANSASRRFYERHGFKAIAFTDGQGNGERCPDALYQLQRTV